MTDAHDPDMFVVADARDWQTLTRGELADLLKRNGFSAPEQVIRATENDPKRYNPFDTFTIYCADSPMRPLNTRR